MKISLIICVYNRLELLHNCLLGVSRQQRIPDEIILTDDGSEADIVGFWQEHKKLFKVPFRLVRQEHNGFRAARVRNNGVHLSTGNLLLFLDQDIVASPGYVKRFEESARPNRFLVSYPVRLTQQQTMQVTDEMVLQDQIMTLLTKKQIAKPRRQFYKDRFNMWLYLLGFSRYAAKLRGGVSGFWRSDYEAVNGYDENFVGWGNEDDNLGKRLLASGVIGLNVTLSEYVYHLYHKPNHQGQRVNQSYAQDVKKHLTKYNYRCQHGLSQPRPDLQIW